MISQQTLIELHDKYEPKVSESLPTFRMATCVECGWRMVEMWHVWLNHESAVTGRQVTKELHFCKDCGQKHGLVVGEPFDLAI